MTSLLLAVAAVAVGFALRPRGLRRHPAGISPRHTSGSSRATADWAGMLDSVAAGVRAGHSLREAYEHARTQCRPHGRAITTATEFQLLPALASTDADESVVLQTMSVAMALGGPVATTLQSGAALLRERAAVRAEAATHAAQARLSARVLTAVPPVFAGWATLSSSSFRGSLFGPFGAVAAALGLTLNAVGWWWMRRIVRRAEQ